MARSSDDTGKYQQTCEKESQQFSLSHVIWLCTCSLSFHAPREKLFSECWKTEQMECNRSAYQAKWFMLKWHTCNKVCVLFWPSGWDGAPFSIRVQLFLISLTGKFSGHTVKRCAVYECEHVCILRVDQNIFPHCTTSALSHDLSPHYIKVCSDLKTQKDVIWLLVIYWKCHVNF